MRFRETPLQGAFIVELERLEDDRGFFARSFCEKEFSAHGLAPRFVQCNVSYNKRAGTLRGMHYQEAPHEEDKLVRCTMGAVHDVIVDIRSGSPTHLQSFGIELSAENRTALFIPRGFAHGFQTLKDDSEVLYQMSEFFQPGSARGMRWDDPALALAWPLPNPILSDKDRAHPLLAKNGP
jgi:dTDP-4-dehydrorhamnose 3,5-epimerase